MIGYKTRRTPPELGAFAIAAIALTLTVGMVPAYGQTVEYYTLPGCHDCEDYERGELENLRRRFAEQGRPIRIEVFSVLEPASFERLTASLVAAGKPYLGTPLIVANGTVLQGPELEERVAFERLAAAFGPTGAPTAAAASGAAAASESAVIAAPPFWIVFAAGLLDGVNPCAMTVLAFLVSSLALSGGNRRAALSIGVGFSVGVFVTYTLTGFGLLGAATTASENAVAASALRAVTIGALLLLSIVSARDAVVSARGKTADIALKLPTPVTKAIHSLIRRAKASRSTAGILVAAGAASLGAGVSLLEFVCTGQVYLPTIVYIARSAPARGFILLIAYNFAFILPLLAVFAAVHFGLRHERLAAFLSRKVVAVKVATACLFTGLAIAMFIR